MLRLLHFGDMHLDAPFASVGMAAGERLREGHRRVFDNIISAARECDLVLISGDLFASGFVLPDTLRSVRDAFASLDCPVVIAPGDSDPYLPGGIWSSTVWSDNVKIFKKDTLSSFEIELPRAKKTVTVYGYAFTSDKMTRSPLENAPAADAGDGKLALLCAHADIRDEMGRVCRTDPDKLLRFGAAYAALGHAAPCPKPLTAHGSTCAYCGTPEAQNFDEAGDDGYNLITFPDNARIPTVERVRVGLHTYVTASVDVAGCARDEDIARRIVTAAESAGYGADVSLRVLLKGSLPYDVIPAPTRIGALAAAALERDGKKLCSLAVEDLSLPALLPGQDADGLDVRAELYRSLRAGLDAGDAETQRRTVNAIRYALSALDGKTVG